MRKKLLRSRSGFEKPESREEAIMQNILGASNVLEPSESNIEEILKSILYNTPYTKEAEFEIEKILLAIKNNGTYDGEGESRDMKILIAILNDLDYTEEAESRIEELFIEWLHQRSSIKVLEGVPPLTFVAKGNPLINYEISGNTVQPGTPTPDSPIIPQGTGDKTANLFDYNAYFDSVFTPYNVFFNYAEIQLQPNTTYTLSTSIEEIGGNPRNTAFIVATSNETPTTASGGISNVSPITKTTESDGILKLYKRISGSGVLPTKGLFDAGDWLMLNTGTTPLPYGYKIPISSANTTTPVYLGEVETTRKIKKLVLTGQESWNKGNYPPTGGYQFFTTMPADIATNSDWITTHFKNGIGLNGSILNGSAFAIYLSLYPEASILPENATANDFNAWLAAQYAAGTPVTVWYVLANEETAVVNEPLMKIGDYADTLSMEQAGVEIPTVNGSNTLDVDTTVKPSNIYIEYK